MNKRKRGELSDSSDTEEVAPGRQILPVANLPHDFDQEPQDGMQYLFLVRRDARQLPHVTRVRNPYEVLETTAVQTLTPSSTNALPCEEWRIAFQAHFSNLRKNLTQKTIDLNHHDSGTKQRVPEKKDRDAWWKFLAGYPESVWGSKGQSVRKKPGTSRRTRECDPSAGLETPSSDVQSRDEACHQSTNTASFFTVDSSTSSEEVQAQLSPPEVTPSHIRDIDHRMSIHLLMYFTHWINIHLQNPTNPLTAISAGHGQWIFSLLTKVEDQLSADEMNLLRNLARACLGLIRIRRTAMSEGVSNLARVENTMQISDGSCWIIFATIAGYWGQRDLRCLSGDSAVASFDGTRWPLQGLVFSM